jgi:serine/threonine-protein kinase PknG
MAGARGAGMMAEPEQLTVDILPAALDWISDGGTGGARRDLENRGYVRILGCEPNERALRFGLERGCRALAILTPDPARKVELVDMANAIRPRTWT